MTYLLLGHCYYLFLSPTLLLLLLLSLDFLISTDLDLDLILVLILEALGVIVCSSSTSSYARFSIIGKRNRVDIILQWRINNECNRNANTCASDIENN